MADTYYTTPTGFGVADDPANVPAGATVITEAAYNVLVADQAADLAADAAAELNQSKADYTTVYAALRSMGMPQAAATLLARSVGDTPAVDPELNVKAMTQQSGSLTFNHAIAAATNVFEKITEVTAITIAESGLYEVTWQAKGEVTLPSGFGQSATTVAAIAKNDAVIAGTETVLESLIFGGSPATTLPAHGVHVTGSGMSYQSLVVGDVITLWAKKVSSVASTHSIRSDADGRSRLGLVRIRPA